MSDIDLIRTLSADPIQYDRAAFIGDGSTTEFLMPNSPIYPGSETVLVDGVDAEHTIDNSLGLITLVDPPANSAKGSVTYKFSFLTDAQLQDLLDLEGDVRLAAADALDTIAASESMIQKKIKILDLQTDGPAITAALQARAKTLREQVFNIEMNESTFDITEQINDKPGFREKVIKDWMRQTT